MMNYRRLIITTVIFFTFAGIAENYAQEFGNEMRHMRSNIGRLNLNDSQKEKINELRLNHKEEMIELRSELELKQLELEKLKSSKNFSGSGYINAVKEISTVKSKMAEARAIHRMNIYDLLDDNQKKEFLSFPEHSGKYRMHKYFRHRDM
jgi:hypothetical protein